MYTWPKWLTQVRKQFNGFHEHTSSSTCRFVLFCDCVFFSSAFIMNCCSCLHAVVGMFSFSYWYVRFIRLLRGLLLLDNICTAYRWHWTSLKAKILLFQVWCESKDLIIYSMQGLWWEWSPMVLIDKRKCSQSAVPSAESKSFVSGRSEAVASTRTEDS